jgi:hypothetical protein
VTDRLPSTEVIAFDEFLDPPGENFDVKEPDLSDIVVHFSENIGSNTRGQDTEDNQNKYIFGPPLDILSRIKAIKYIHKALQFA